MGRLHRIKPETHVAIIKHLAVQNGVSQMIAEQVGAQLLPIYQHLHADGNYFVCEEGRSQLLNWLLQQPGTVPAQAPAPAPTPVSARMAPVAPVATMPAERPRQVPGGPVPPQAPMMNTGGNGQHADAPPSLTDAPPAPPVFDQ